ncbi:MAG: hypothetical protein DRG78_01530 [Epsilonproteobacteria bacterium]|nr:MAG: hypothetical protein DRG78_01530 [Campylobacterota bacterium]
MIPDEITGDYTTETINLDFNDSILHEHKLTAEAEKIAKKKKRQKERKKLKNKQENREKQRILLEKIEDIVLNSKKLIFVSFDIEAFEFDQRKLTEVGISIYRDGKCSTQHIIINENIKYCNKKRVPNNKFNFSFGNSIKKSTFEAMSMLSKVLHKADYIVGHGVSNDFNYIERETKSKKYNHIKMSSNLFNIIDTQDIFNMIRSNKKKTSQASADSLFYLYGVQFKFLHNAGNDARYTMELYIKMIASISHQEVAKIKLSLSKDIVISQ